MHPIKGKLSGPSCKDNFLFACFFVNFSFGIQILEAWELVGIASTKVEDKKK